MCLCIKVISPDLNTNSWISDWSSGIDTAKRYLLNLVLLEMTNHFNRLIISTYLALFDFKSWYRAPTPNEKWCLTLNGNSPIAAPMLKPVISKTFCFHLICGILTQTVSYIVYLRTEAPRLSSLFWPISRIVDWLQKHLVCFAETSFWVYPKWLDTQWGNLDSSYWIPPSFQLLDIFLNYFELAAAINKNRKYIKVDVYF